MISCLLFAVAASWGCSPEVVTGPLQEDTTSLATPDAERVGDLQVASSTQASVTLTWTEIDDGTGDPAHYRLRYDESPLEWSGAEDGCDRTIEGVRVGAPMSCTVAGLAPVTQYDFQVMSYRVGGGEGGAAYSNVATGSTVESLEPAVDSTSPVPSGVTDLTVTDAAETTLTVRWTQVDDGTGEPAWYRVKHGAPPIDWSNASVGCDPTLAGSAIGEPMSCTIEGLPSDASYDVQLMSYRVVDGAWENEQYSNVATGATQAPAPSGIWVDRASLMDRPTSGPDWDRLLTDAARDPGVADISDQNSKHDVYTLAAAIVCVRIGDYCAKARRGVLDAIGTEIGGRWLTVGRNLASYIIAADLLDLRSGYWGTEGARFEQWVEGWLTKELPDNITATPRPFGPFHSGANAAAQEGFAYAAVAAYLDDSAALGRAWDAFRTFVCDPGAPDNEGIYLDPIIEDGWAHDDARPCAVNPMGTSKQVPVGVAGAGTMHRIDGALGADMRRGGRYQWLPGYTSYPWVGLEGLVPAAVILERAGYPAFQAADRAMLRTHEYLWYLRSQTGDVRWFDGIRASEIVQLVNQAYDVELPINETVGDGRTVGYTGWTHP